MNISLKDLRPRLTAMMQLVKDGQTVSITERGKVIAQISAAIDQPNLDPGPLYAVTPKNETVEGVMIFEQSLDRPETISSWANLPKSENSVAHTKSVQKAKDELLKKINRG